MDQNDLSEIDRTSSKEKISFVSTERYDQKGFSNAQPIWHLILLYLTTGGLYQFYWFYRNWKQLNDLLNLGWRPLLRTMLFFIPLVNWIVAFELFQDIRDFSKYAGIKKTYSPYLVFLAFFPFFGFHLILPEPLVSAFFSFFGFYLILPEPFNEIDSLIRLLLPILPIWSLAVVQSTLNAYWEKKQPGLPERVNLSLPEICIMLILPILYIFKS